MRVDDPEWEAAEAVTKRLQSDRSKEVKQFWDWYFRAPGVDLQRPSLDFVGVAIAEERGLVDDALKQERDEREREKLERRKRALEDMAVKVHERSEAGE